MAEVVALQIGSEDEAWEYLEQALEGTLPDNLAPAVVFENWPRLDIYLPDTELQSSISPTMMAALVDFQRSLYRTHALITTGERTARISNAEKERVEFRVKVEGGSSKLGIDLSDIAQSWGVAAIGRMTPEQTMIAIIATVAVIGATAAWAMYLKNKTEVRKVELEEKGKEQLFDAFKTLTEQDTKRQKMWLKAMQAVPVLKEIRDEADEAKTELLKAVADEGGGSINGVRLDPEVANDLIKVTRKKAEDETVRSVYRVARVDTTTPDGFRVTLKDVRSGDEVTASLMDALISDQHRERIREAEWSKQPVTVELRKRVSRGRTIEATVVDVQDPPARAAG